MVYLHAYHIVLALSKITNTEPITQISESLGYTNPSAMFKRHLEKTPQQFRNAAMSL